MRCSRRRACNTPLPALPALAELFRVHTSQLAIFGGGAGAALVGHVHGSLMRFFIFVFRTLWAHVGCRRGQFAMVCYYTTTCRSKQRVAPEFHPWPCGASCVCVHQMCLLHSGGRAAEAKGVGTAIRRHMLHGVPSHFHGASREPPLGQPLCLRGSSTAIRRIKRGRGMDLYLMTLRAHD